MAQQVKNPHAMKKTGDAGFSLGWEYPLEE